LLGILALLAAGAAVAQAASDPVQAVWSGAVTARSARINALIDPERSSLVLEVHAADGALRFSHALQAGDRTSPVDPVSADGRRTVMVSVQVSGLDPGTDYRYGFRAPESGTSYGAGTLRSFPEGPASFNFAFGNCAETGSGHPVFGAIETQRPLFFIHLGDLHYLDISRNEPALFRAGFRQVLDSAAQGGLYRNVPLVYVWDDHDYGPNNAGAESPTRQAARLAYRQYVPHYPLPAGEGNAAIYQAFEAGRAAFIVTDNRSEKSPRKDRDTPKKSLLGEAQKAWFKQRLLEASRSLPVVFWANATPWIGPPEKNKDQWWSYANERAELAAFLFDNGIDNLVILAGDAHMIALDDGRNSQYAATDAPGPVVFHGASLDRRGSVKGGPFSHGTFPGGGQYGWVEVLDEGGESVTVRFSGRTADGEQKVFLERTYRPSRPGGNRQR